MWRRGRPKVLVLLQKKMRVNRCQVGNLQSSLCSPSHSPYVPLRPLSPLCTNNLSVIRIQHSFFCPKNFQRFTSCTVSSSNNIFLSFKGQSMGVESHHMSGKCCWSGNPIISVVVEIFCICHSLIE